MKLILFEENITKKMNLKTIFKWFYSLLLIVLFSPVLFSVDERAVQDLDLNFRDRQLMETYHNLPEDRVIIYGQRKSYNHETQVVTLSGDPYIITADDFLSANTIEFYRESNIGKLNGNARVINFENNVTIAGDAIDYNTETKMAIVRDNAHIYVPDQQVVLTADRLERFANNEKLIAIGNVHIFREIDGATVDCDRIEYTPETNLIKLIGDPKIFYTGTTYSGDEAFVYTDTEIFVIEGNARLEREHTLATAEKMEYHSGKDGSEEYAMLIGEAVVVEYSRTDSILQGNPYRIARSDEIKYVPLGESEQIKLIEDASIITYYVEEDTSYNRQSNHQSRFVISTREGYGDLIEYYGDRGQYTKISGDAMIKQEGYIAYAEEIEFFPDEGNQIYLNEDAHVYEFYDPAELAERIQELDRTDPTGQLSQNAIKRHSEADNIEYLQDPQQKVILDGDAKVTEENRTASGDRIVYLETDPPEITISGNARLVEAERIATAHEIKYFDREEPVTILSGDSSRRLHAELTDGEHNAKGMKIFYYRYLDDTQKLIMIGNPVITQEGRSVSGDIIEYYIGENDHGIISGHARIQEGERIAYADVIEYAKIVIEDKEAFLQEYGDQNENIDTDTVDQLIDNPSNLNMNVPEDQQDDNQMNADSLEQEQSQAEEEGIRLTEDSQSMPTEDTTYTIERIYLSGNLNMYDEGRFVRADRGEYYLLGEDEYNRSNSKIVLMGNIFFEEENRQGWAQRIEYTVRYPQPDKKTEMAALCGNIIVKQEGRNATGDLMEYHKEVMVVHGSTEESSYPFEYFVITGNAKLQDPQMYGEADTIEFYVDDDESEEVKHEHAVFLGNAYLEDKENKATAHRIDYDLTESENSKEELLLLTGNAVVIQETTVSYSRASATIIEMLRSEIDGNELEIARFFKNARFFDHAEEQIIYNGRPVRKMIEDREITAGMITVINVNDYKPRFNEYMEGRPFDPAIVDSYTFLADEPDNFQYPVLTLTQWYENINTPSTIQTAEASTKKTITTVTSDILRYSQLTKKAVAQGDVKITQEDIQAFGTTGEYFQENNEVLLTGRCRVVQGSNMVVGGEIFVDLDEKTVNVLGTPYLSLDASGSEEFGEEEEATSQGIEGMEGEMDMFGDAFSETFGGSGGAE